MLDLLEFHTFPDGPVLHPDAEMFEVRRKGMAEKNTTKGVLRWRTFP
jgi:hypothetical protein